MKIVISIFLTIMSFIGVAQEADTYTVINKADAMQYAEKYDAKILMVFAGSDWCRPCIMFKKEILDQPDFVEYAQGKVAVLYLDFPSKKKNSLSKEQTQHNEALAEQYNLSGTFPKVILMDQDFVKLKEIDYEGQSCKTFIQSI